MVFDLIPSLVSAFRKEEALVRLSSTSFSGMESRTTPPPAWTLILPSASISALLNKIALSKQFSSRIPDLGSGSVLDKNRDEPHDVNITCAEFPMGDANNYYLGSLNGVTYKNAIQISIILKF